MKANKRFTSNVTAIILLSLLFSSCSPAPAAEPTALPPKPEPAEPIGVSEETLEALAEPSPEPVRPVLEDIGYANAPYPTDEFGELLWQDDFNVPDPVWRYQDESPQPRYEQEGDTTFAAFEAQSGQRSMSEITLEHPRNVTYQVSFRPLQGFANFSFAGDPMAGTQAILTCFGKDEHMTFRLSLRTGHEAPLYQLVEFTSSSENGWANLEIRQYDRYVDLFVDGRHSFAFKMPDDMLLDHGSFTFEVYDPFGEDASMDINSFAILETLPENVFLDTLPLTPEIDRSQQVEFSSLPFEPVQAELPGRIQAAAGWQVEYLIAPGAVRSPNDLEFAGGDELVVLQQRNWGLISLSPDGESSWYLDTKEAMNELVTNGMLDRDLEGNLYLMHNQRVFLVDQPGSARELFEIQGHSTSLAQSPLDGMLYFLEDGAIKRWTGSVVETVQEEFAESGQLLFLEDGSPFYYRWGASQVIELIPETWEFKQAVFNSEFALPEITPSSFSRLNSDGTGLVLTYNSEVLHIDPQTGSVQVLATGFNQLEGISTASDGRICFTSRFDSGVYCWKDGALDIAAMPNFLMTPMGMAVDNQGEIFSGNDEATHLFRYDPQGNFLEAYDVNVCQAPQVDMAVDDADNLYVSAGEYFTLASSLSRIDPDGRVEVLVNYPDIRYPSGIDWYDGHVYVIEAETGNLYRLEEDHSFTTILNVPASPPDNTIPMRIDRDGNFYIFITADKLMKLYRVTRNDEWTEINIGVDLRDLVSLEYWEEKHALLLGFSGFWDASGKVIVYDIASGEAQTILTGIHAVSGLAVTPDGAVLINDDWDNAMLRLIQR